MGYLLEFGLMILVVYFLAALLHDVLNTSQDLLLIVNNPRELTTDVQATGLVVIFLRLFDDLLLMELLHM
jgi:hypothetical protein